MGNLVLKPEGRKEPELPKDFGKMNEADVEAYQFTKKNYRRDKEPVWLRQAINNGKVILFSQYGGDVIGGEIKTLEGTMIISENDFIIKGANGEFYPCKPDMFEATKE